MSKKKVTPISEETAAPVETDSTSLVEGQEAVEGASGTEAEPEQIISQAALDAFSSVEGGDIDRIYRFYPEEVNINHSRNARRKGNRTLADMEDMIADVREKGVHTPLLGRFDPETHAVDIVFGLGRYEVVKHINANLAEGEEPLTLPITFNTNVNDAHAALRYNISENIKRRNLKPFDIVDGMKLLKDSGMEHAAIAQEFGMKSKGAVTGYLSLLKLPIDIQEQIDKGVLTLRNGLELVALLKTNPDKVAATAAKWVTKAETEGAPVSAAKSREDTASAGGSRIAPVTLKGVKDTVDSSTGPAEDPRVRAVSLVFSALISATAEKEMGIGKVSAKNFTAKLTAALDQVSNVKKAAAKSAA